MSLRTWGEGAALPRSCPMLPTRENRERMLAWRLAWEEGAGLDLSDDGGPPGEDTADGCGGCWGPALPVQASLALLLLLCVST